MSIFLSFHKTKFQCHFNIKLFDQMKCHVISLQFYFHSRSCVSNSPIYISDSNSFDFLKIGVEFILL